jgi:hypothetical protein
MLEKFVGFVCNNDIIMTNHYSNVILTHVQQNLCRGFVRKFFRSTIQLLFSLSICGTIILMIEYLKQNYIRIISKLNTMYCDQKIGLVANLINKKNENGLKLSCRMLHTSDIGFKLLFEYRFVSV